MLDKAIYSSKIFNYSKIDKINILLNNNNLYSQKYYRDYYL